MKLFTLISIVLVSSVSFAQVIESRIHSDLPGIELRPEIRVIVKEIETKAGKKLHADFVELDAHQLGSSFIDEDGIPVVLIDHGLEDDKKKLEAVFVHELLHLRLTVNGYPSFLWSPSVRTIKGRAIDVEQSNINDLRSIIEHAVFRSDMEKFGLFKAIDLAGDTASIARAKKGQEAGQDDVINFTRALLEYLDPRDTAQVREIYLGNNWRSSVATGQAIAEIIRTANLKTPKALETVFIRCLVKLYPPQSGKFTFTLSPDNTNKHFRRLIVNTVRVRSKIRR